MSDGEVPVLPFQLFVEICEALGYDPGLVVSMRINHYRVTVVYETPPPSHEVAVRRHLIEYPEG